MINLLNMTPRKRPPEIFTNRPRNQTWALFSWEVHIIHLATNPWVPASQTPDSSRGGGGGEAAVLEEIRDGVQQVLLALPGAGAGQVVQGEAVEPLQQLRLGGVALLAAAGRWRPGASPAKAGGTPALPSQRTHTHGTNTSVRMPTRLQKRHTCLTRTPPPRWWAGMIIF